MRSITITGSLGSGKSTIAKMLAECFHFDTYSTGNAQRQIAAKHNMTTLELNKLADQEAWVDQEIDGVFKDLNASDKNYVVDSRLAWHFMPDSFKVKLIVSPTVAADRIFNDKKRNGENTYATPTDALNVLLARRASEVERFKKTYGVDIEDDRHFDFVLDTSDLTPEQVCNRICDAYQHVR